MIQLVLWTLTCLISQELCAPAKDAVHTMTDLIFRAWHSHCTPYMSFSWVLPPWIFSAAHQRCIWAHLESSGFELGQIHEVAPRSPLITIPSLYFNFSFFLSKLSLNMETGYLCNSPTGLHIVNDEYFLWGKSCFGLFFNLMNSSK